MPRKKSLAKLPCATNQPGAHCKNKVKESGYCNTCRKKKQRELDPVKYAWRCNKDNARRRGIPHTITLEQFRGWEHLDEYMKHKGQGPDDLTIDRKKNELGYTIDNIQVLPNRMNVLKEKGLGPFAQPVIRRLMGDGQEPIHQNSAVGF